MEPLHTTTLLITLLCAFLGFLLFFWKPFFLHRRRRQRPRNIIVTLPPELLNLIETRLSLQSKACFALTCKRLYAQFGSVLSAPEFRLPKLMHWHSYIFTPQTNFHVRPELLIRLENEKWKYCTTCLRLHPATEFPYDAVGTTHNRRVCTIHSDTYIYGLVDLCPCTHMTFRDKNRITTYLKNMQRDSQVLSRQAPILRKFVADKNERSLTHTCSITHLTKDIDITVLAFLDEHSNLIIETKFDIKSPRGHFYDLRFPCKWKPSSRINECLDYAINSSSPTYYGEDLSGEITILKLIPSGEYFWKEFCFKTTKNFGNKSEHSGPRWSEYAECDYRSLDKFEMDEC